MHRRALLIALLLCVQACGIKGPLYIETAEQKKKADERRERMEAAKHRDKQTGAAPKAKGAPGSTASTLAPSASTAPDTESAPAAPADVEVTDETFGPSAPPH